MKDHADRHDEFLPARRSYAPPPVASPEPLTDDYADTSGLPQSGGRGLSFKIVLRAMRRYWWQAMTLWLLVSGGLVFLAYTRIKPTYDAVARIKVEHMTLDIFRSATAQIDYAQFMETQVSNLTSPTVIQAAMTADPSLTALPLLRNSVDPEGEIRRALTVGVVPKTTLIQVQMSSQDKNEGPRIVNAVVRQFLELAGKSYERSTKEKIDRLTALAAEQTKIVENRREKIAALQQRLGSADVSRFNDRNKVSIDVYDRFSQELTNVEIKVMTCQAKVDQLRNDKTPALRMDDEQLKQEVTDEFYNDPRVDALQAQRVKAEAKLTETMRLVRSPSDPARTRAEDNLHEIEGKINDLWNQLRPSLLKKVSARPIEDATGRSLADAEAELAATKAHEQQLRDRLAAAQVESTKSESDVLKLEYLRRDLTRDETVLDKIQSNLKQFEFEEQTPVAKTELVFEAQPTDRPNGDRRVQLMAAAPVITGLMILSLLVLLELRGARVSDPEELSNRVNLQVIGVVPPLPQIRNSAPAAAGVPATAADLKAQRELDEFVQSLDHLRVALCARRDQWGRDRHCVLITSACGSEGKTTLAAQLAERCVNAGLMTLLIDGDLRNPTLSRMLDAVSNPGLINVLRGELTAEDVVMVIGDAGGFHLIPAGNPRMDPSRLLASDRLGKLLAQARESFDMIIVDAPPVLPVPDALTIGRWVDGAVLAVRYDTSRFPLVERAYRRLTNVGVSVIGAVVNGVRSMESTYGGYYGYGSYGTTCGDGVSSTSAPASSSAVDD